MSVFYVGTGEIYSATLLPYLVLTILELLSLFVLLLLLMLLLLARFAASLELLLPKSGH